MIFLSEPAIGEPVEIWEAWLSELSKMDQNDASVLHAIKQANIAIATTLRAGR